MLNVQCSMFNAQCSMLNAQCSMLNAQCSMLNARCSLLNVHCSLKSSPKSPPPGSNGNSAPTNNPPKCSRATPAAWPTPKAGKWRKKTSLNSVVKNWEGETPVEPYWTDKRYSSFGDAIFIDWELIVNKMLTSREGNRKNLCILSSQHAIAGERDFVHEVFFCSAKESPRNLQRTLSKGSDWPLRGGVSDLSRISFK